MLLCLFSWKVSFWSLFCLIFFFFVVNLHMLCARSTDSIIPVVIKLSLHIQDLNVPEFWLKADIMSGWTGQVMWDWAQVSIQFFLHNGSECCYTLCSGYVMDSTLSTLTFTLMKKSVSSTLYFVTNLMMLVPSLPFA